MRILSFLIFLIILFLGVTFAVSNAQQVSLNYYFGTSSLPLSLLSVIVLGIGAFIGWMVSVWVWIRLKGENIRLSYRIKTLEKEINELRASPVNETP